VGKYPWEDWMDGDVHEVVDGVDYDCARSSFCTMLRHKANDAYTKVSIENRLGGNIRFMFGDDPDFDREERLYRWYKGEKVYD